MPHSFVAFIDESGDDGLTKFREPGGRGGASSWLVISAVVFRAVHRLDAVAWRDEISGRMPDRKSRTLHFAEMNHSQKLVASQVIANKPVRAISVVAAKRPIPTGIYTNKNQLYFYMTRYLIERLSWLCRDMRPRVPEGDGRCAITFSRRGGMSYEDFRQYLRGLKAAIDKDVRIHWPVIDIDAVQAEDHSRSASLQLADAVASSVSASVEPDRYGNIEPRYALNLLPRMYRHRGGLISYGIKVVPKLEQLDMSDDQHAFFASCGWGGRPPGP